MRSAMCLPSEVSCTLAQEPAADCDLSFAGNPPVLVHWCDGWTGILDHFGKLCMVYVHLICAFRLSALTCIPDAAFFGFPRLRLPVHDETASSLRCSIRGMTPPCISAVVLLAGKFFQEARAFQDHYQECVACPTETKAPQLT